jgi:hypothetical protein
MQCVNKSIPPRLPQGLTTPLDWAQPSSGANRPGSRGVSSNLPKICLRIRGESVLRQGGRAAIARCEPRFRKLSSNGTTPEIDQSAHAEVFGNLARFRAAGREETTQQPSPAKLLDLNLPALGATAQSLEYPGQLRRGNPDTHKFVDRESRHPGIQTPTNLSIGNPDTQGIQTPTNLSVGGIQTPTNLSVGARNPDIHKLVGRGIHRVLC